MEDNNYNRYYINIPVHELIGYLNNYKKPGNTMSQAWYEALIKHLAERPLSDDQRRIIDEILDKNPDAKVISEGVTENSFKNLESVSQPGRLPDRNYPALKSIAVIFIVFAWLVGIATFIATIFYFSKGTEGILVALPTIIGGAIAVLMLVATSELIKLFIDIENNTRKAANRS